MKQKPKLRLSNASERIVFMLSVLIGFVIAWYYCVDVLKFVVPIELWIILFVSLFVIHYYGNKIINIVRMLKAKIKS